MREKEMKFCVEYAFQNCEKKEGGGEIESTKGIVLVWNFFYKLNNFYVYQFILNCHYSRFCKSYRIFYIRYIIL